MTLRRWDPLRELLTLQERMNRIFEENIVRGRSETGTLRPASWSPPTDAYETRESIVVELELAGVNREDVEIRIHEDLLVVNGVRRPASSQRPDAYHRMERSFAPFSRSFRLGTAVSPEDVSARLEDGVLHIELPKLPREKS